jgi:hypothetical protein
MDIASTFRQLLRVVPIAFLLISSAVAQEGVLRSEPPRNITVDEIIRRFTAQEKDCKAAVQRYSWRQSVKVQTLLNETSTGEYQSVFDSAVDDRGRRVQNFVFTPQSTLREVEMTREDLDLLEKELLFTVTSDDRAQYQVTYLGQQREDELNTYVFRVVPLHSEPGRLLFDGSVWVDERDLAVVKSFGHYLPDEARRSGKGRFEEKKYPNVTTWRDKIDKQCWLPVFSKAEEWLNFKNSARRSVHLKTLVKYTDYRCCGMTPSKPRNDRPAPQQSFGEAPGSQR